MHTRIGAVIGTHVGLGVAAVFMWPAVGPDGEPIPETQ